mmetsp:Transcript_17576/g.61804  ORF Transcript_17576/g.61804 Transcript_17576/m.61804 type:complete len:223 (-) Transcript_17576:595-1263(-)
MCFATKLWRRLQPMTQDVPGHARAWCDISRAETARPQPSATAHTPAAAAMSGTGSRESARRSAVRTLALVSVDILFSGSARNQPPAMRDVRSTRRCARPSILLRCCPAASRRWASTVVSSWKRVCQTTSSNTACILAVPCRAFSTDKPSACSSVSPRRPAPRRNASDAPSMASSIVAASTAPWRCAVTATERTREPAYCVTKCAFVSLRPTPPRRGGRLRWA